MKSAVYGNALPKNLAKNPAMGRVALDPKGAPEPEVKPKPKRRRKSKKES